MERRFCQRAATVECRDDGTPAAIVGHAAVFFRDGDADTEYEMWPGVVERIAGTAFDRALEEGDDARALFNHDPSNLLGRVSAGTVELTKDDTGLRYRIPINIADPDHARIVPKIQRGDLSGSSFAFRATEERWIEPKKGEGGPEIRIIESVELFDVGPVSFPAYPAADAGLRAHGDSGEARASYDAWIAARGKLAATLAGYQARAAEVEIGCDV